ncbi:CASP-like protein 4D1 isoform X2 [Pistacia vera]|uniref:CASP-like protein 4D1 isoform X2 n=1 Tax=Pistacia vera TaxID=55513 RepID=UPI001262F0D3|nr:CASP-like protein 4D1 isoform X2 [Pistacia vera]
MATRLAALFLRILTFASLFVSMIILVTNSGYIDLPVYDLTFKIRFQDIYAYRYMLATTVISIAYTILQVAFSLYYVSTGNRVISGDGSFKFDFYGDKVISYVLATGGAAAFGVTKDMKVVFAGSGNKLFDRGYGCASLVLFWFACTAALSIYSSYALPKRFQ